MISTKIESIIILVLFLIILLPYLMMIMATKVSFKIQTKASDGHHKNLLTARKIRIILRTTIHIYFSNKEVARKRDKRKIQILIFITKISTLLIRNISRYLKNLNIKNMQIT